MEPVRGLYVTNLLGNNEASLSIARANQGGDYPVGTLIQLVPGEAMVKREKGFSKASRDWEFFNLEVTENGTRIQQQGTHNVKNLFGQQCLGCHLKAEPKWDMICETDHGCDPLPFTRTMITAIQKTDPRCPKTPLTQEEKEALTYLFGNE